MLSKFYEASKTHVNNCLDTTYQKHNVCRFRYIYAFILIELLKCQLKLIIIISITIVIIVIMLNNAVVWKKTCQAIIFWDNCHNKFQKKCPHIKENCVLKIQSITKTWRAQNVNTLYGRLDWYFRFLTSLNSYGHNSIKFWHV